jgi:hypothetical protein
VQSPRALYTGPAHRAVVAHSITSREALIASAEQLKSLRENRRDTIEILALPSLARLSGTCYRVFGAHHIINEVGVDREGRKHILSLGAGATENAAAGNDF